MKSSAIPLLVVLLSFEGVSDFTTVERESSVQVRQRTPLSVKEIKGNLAKPFELDGSRHWLLSIFPMPYHIEAGSLNVGDIHKIKTRYQRWFITNTHIGESELLIEHVGPNSVSTKMLSDTTYFSSYLKMHGTKIEFIPLETGGTEIILNIHYRRKLDPAWYFHPMQKIVVEQMADFLIQEIMIRESTKV